MNERLFSVLARALVLFTAMPVHECAHGFVAFRLGDDTAKKQGRLTLNPFHHLDLFGSLLLLFTGFGWAKPVQIDPRNFKNPKNGMALSSLAGPVSNILLALVLLIVYKLFGAALPSLRYMNLPVLYIDLILRTMIFTNLYLAIFNLVPVPPLDGSKIFAAVLPEKAYFFMLRYERYVYIVLIVLIFTGYLSAPLRYVANWVAVFLDAITFPLGRLYRGGIV